MTSKLKYYGFAEDQLGNRLRIRGMKYRRRLGVYGVLSQRGKILLTKSYLPYWEFPGGEVEENESIKQALIREFHEETGLNVGVGSFIGMREGFYYSPNKVLFYSIQLFFNVFHLSPQEFINKQQNSEVSLVKRSEITLDNSKIATVEVIKHITNSKQSFYISTILNEHRK